MKPNQTQSIVAMAEVVLAMAKRLEEMETSDQTASDEEVAEPEPSALDIPGLSDTESAESIINMINEIAIKMADKKTQCRRSSVEWGTYYYWYKANLRSMSLSHARLPRNTKSLLPDELKKWRSTINQDLCKRVLEQTQGQPPPSYINEGKRLSRHPNKKTNRR